MSGGDRKSEKEVECRRPSVSFVLHNAELVDAASIVAGRLRELKSEIHATIFLAKSTFNTLSRFAKLRQKRGHVVWTAK